MKGKAGSIKISLFLIVTVFTLIGCASIVSKSNWPIKISTTPEQADVRVTDLKEGKDIFVGKTPTIVTLSSKGGYFKSKRYKVEATKEGFQTQTMEIVSTLNGWYFGNIIFGGLIGLVIVDPLTGAMWTLDPKDVNITLAAKTTEAPSEKRSLSIVLIKDVPDELRDKLIRVK